MKLLEDLRHNRINRRLNILAGFLSNPPNRNALPNEFATLSVDEVDIEGTLCVLGYFRLGVTAPSAVITASIAVVAETDVWARRWNRSGANLPLSLDIEIHEKITALI